MKAVRDLAALAGRVRELLEAAGLAAAENPERGYDHGVFIPLKLVLPDAGAVEAAAERLSGVGPVERTDEGVLATDPSGNTVLVRS